MTRQAFLVCMPLLAATVIVNAATVQTADTNLHIEAANAGLRVISLSGSQDKAQWVSPGSQAGAIPFVPSAVMGEQIMPLQWRLVRESDLEPPYIGHTFVFTCSAPNLEISSFWKGTKGSGPIEHELSITNRGPQEVKLPLQPSFAFDSIDAPQGHVLENWWIEKGSYAPDNIGVHVTPVGEGFSQTLDFTGYAPDDERLSRTMIDESADLGLVYHHDRYIQVDT